MNNDKLERAMTLCARILPEFTDVFNAMSDKDREEVAVILGRYRNSPDAGRELIAEAIEAVLNWTEASNAYLESFKVSE